MDARLEYLAAVEIRELKAELSKLRDERDALAAHAAEGERLVRELLVDDVTNDATPLIEWCEIGTSVASLARRDAVKQAEGAEMVRDRLREKGKKAFARGDFACTVLYHRCANVADNKADVLRRQAEENNHD